MPRRKHVSQRKIWIILVMISVFLVGNAFAADICTTETTKGLETFKTILTVIGSFASWVWVILGSIAGKLMTNTFVYGEFIHLDGLLRKIRQISRTFVNYTIWILFLIGIFNYIFNFSTKAKNPTSFITELLIASILVQASRFLVMVLLDFSTIGIATISSFPSQVISSNSNYRESLLTSIKSDPLLSKPFKTPPKGVEINVFADVFSQKDKELLWKEYDVEKLPDDFEKNLIDSLLPKSDNLGGPLVYLGFSVFQSQNQIINYEANPTNCIEMFSKAIISLILSSGMIILYAFSLLVLVAVLIIRLLYLRIFIAASPIIVLLSRKKLIEDFLGLKLNLSTPALNLGDMIVLVFKPVFFALWISIMILFVVILQGFFLSQDNWSSEFDNGSVKVSETITSDQARSINSYQSELTIWEHAKVALYHGTKSFKDIMLAFMTLALMWYFVKLAFSSGKTKIWWIDKLTSGVMETAEKVVGNVGIIPTPAGQIGLKQAKDIPSTLIKNKQGQLEAEETERLKAFYRDIGIETGALSMSESQKTKLKEQANATNLESYPSLILSIKNQNNGIKFNDIPVSSLHNWIQNVNKHSSKDQIFSKYFGLNWQDIPNIKLETWDKAEEKYLKELFKSATRVQTFYQKMLWGKNNIFTYEGLISDRGIVKN